MPYRFWLPLLLICVLAAEGVLGAWAGARMAMEAVASVATSTTTGEADPDGEPAKSVLAQTHGDHGRSSMPPHHADCTCVDSTSCECICVLVLYPPTSVKLFAGTHPPVSLDTALPMLELPTSKLSRVFRPPIV